MKVQLRDGHCSKRSCRGQVQIVDADEETMTVVCTVCNKRSRVPFDSYAKNGHYYWAQFMDRQVVPTVQDSDESQNEERFDAHCAS